MSGVAKQPLQGLTAQPLSRLAQRAGADAFIVLSRQGQLQHLSHVHDGAVSKQGPPSTSQSACSMGSRRLRSVATPVICKACSIHCWGMLL